MKNNYFFTSESVSEGHPDKICDRISDAVVDLMLNKFPEARVACETMVSTNRTIIAGEYRLPKGIDITNDEIEKLKASGQESNDGLVGKVAELEAANAGYSTSIKSLEEDLVRVKSELAASEAAATTASATT